MKKKQVHQHKTKMKESFGDRMVGVVCYIIFSLCALVCVYPFYYIFINTISANDLSARRDSFLAERNSFSELCERTKD